jgi:ribonuclease HI
VPENTALPKRDVSSSGTKARSKAAAYSYLSVVDGVPMRHTSWTECERRVRGQSNARFKKATSAADEAAILRGWGVALR